MLFKHQDGDGDNLTVEEWPHESGRDWLVFQTADPGTGLFHEDVIRLRDRLTEWLGEDRTSAAPAPLTAADVRAIAAEVVGDLLARRATEPETDSDVSPCTIPGCDKFPGVSQHFEHDPEPRDVGHPAAPVTLAEALADPTPANMDALWSPQITTAERPREKVVITPECGLCKAPWNDGHGQPGDPCTGAPKQLVGCECRHSWRAHNAEHGCTADNWECDCTRTPPSTPGVRS